MRHTGLFGALAFLLLLAANAGAACVSPAGVAGQTRFASPDLLFCDGSNWNSLSIADTGVACTTAGLINLSGTDLRFCNGSSWISVDGPTVASACTAAQAGTFTHNSSQGRMEWCNGANWKVMGNPPADPCLGAPAPGTVCPGGAIFAGVLSPGSTSNPGATDRYMTTPGGCSDIAAPSGGTGDETYSLTDFTVTCSGTDFVLKSWRGDGTNYNIPTLTNFTGTSSNTDNKYGSENTAIIAAITASNQGAYHPAARYCDKMVFGGYSDWFLPSRYELHLLRTNRASIPGLATLGDYWSSTESSDSQAYEQALNTASGTALITFYRFLAAPSFSTPPPLIKISHTGLR